ncbi:hypothetical protein KKG05_06435 [bacterium]|nr:hypothetical protein [bacterium]
MIAFSAFESNTYYALFGDANHINIILTRLESDENVQNLVNQARSDTDIVNAIAERIKKLLPKSEEPTKLHPYDHSIATYLYVLSKSDIDTFREIKDVVYTSYHPGLWWTTELLFSITDISKGSNMTEKTSFGLSPSLEDLRKDSLEEEPQRITIQYPQWS